MSKLAIHGGAPVRTKSFPAWPVFDEEETRALGQVLESGKWWHSGFGEAASGGEAAGRVGSQVGLFQEEFARHQGSRYAVACANGTGALELLLRALDIGPGMEVIVPAYTYMAGCSCVLQSNAVPIFVDIDPRTYNIDPGKVEEAITPETAALIPCHFGGQMADMDRLTELCRKHGLYLIEDAAHAHGSRWDGRGAGTMGIGGTFSFQNSKNMTAGEGGIVLTDGEKLAQRIESLASLGRRHGRPWYEFHEIGWNYRMTEFQAAILRCQLGRLERQNALRRENAAILAEGFDAIRGLDPVEVDPRAETRSVHIYMLRYSPEDFKGLSRARLIEAVNAEGIPASAGYAHPLYRNPVFSNKAFHAHGCPVSCSLYGKEIDYASFAERCPVAERACSHEAVWLAHRLLLGDGRDMEDIVRAFAKIREHCDELI